MLDDLGIGGGACDTCHANPAIYRCPGCRAKSCSLACVHAHKRASACSALRDRTSYVATSDMTEQLMHSDVALLNDGVRRRGQAVRHTAAVAAGAASAAPLTGSALARRRLQRAAEKRGVTLRLMPDGMSRMRCNTSHARSDADGGGVAWRVDLVFPHAGGASITLDAVPDDRLLVDALRGLLADPACPSRVQEAYTEAAQEDRVAFAMRAAGRPANDLVYHRADASASLAHALDHTVVIEYPTVIVLRLPDDDVSGKYPRVDDQTPSVSPLSLHDPHGGGGGGSSSSSTERPAKRARLIEMID